MSNFVIKDSGERAQFSGGMVRDVTTGKTDFSLALDGPMFTRWAIHLTKGAVKYAKRNWMKAEGEEEYARFRESALRHFLQWFNGDTDEDHASAVFFNLNGAEYVKGKMAAAPQTLGEPGKAIPYTPPAQCSSVYHSAISGTFRCSLREGHAMNHMAGPDLTWTDARAQ